MRVQLLEALLEMGTEEFTRGELAGRHGLERKNVNRVFDSLVEDGFVERVAGGPRPTFRVREGSLRLHLLSQFESALSLAERAGLEDASSDAGRRFAGTFGQALAATVSAAGQSSAESGGEGTASTGPTLVVSLGEHE